MDELGGSSAPVSISWERFRDKRSILAAFKWNRTQGR